MITDVHHTEVNSIRNTFGITLELVLTNKYMITVDLSTSPLRDCDKYYSALISYIAYFGNFKSI